MKAVERYLNDRGFVASRPVELTDTPTFTGRLNVLGYKVQLELRFTEGLYDYPKAFLPEWQHDEKLRQRLGIRHIDARGHLCYEDTSRTWWDSSMATEMVCGVLSRIEELLSNLIAGKISPEEIARDFQGYWDDQFRIYVAEKLQNGQKLKRLRGANGCSDWLVRENKDHWIESDGSALNDLWLVHRLSLAPTKINPNRWPVNSVADVFQWLGENNQKNMEVLVKKLSVSLKTESKNAGLSRLVGIVLIWPDEKGRDILGCAFSFIMPKAAHSSISGQRLKPTIHVLNNDSSAVNRYGLIRADQDYILTRNNPSSDNKLKNRKVVLIGAGTIGGYLGKLLCAQGAGSGSRGVLHIVDPDSFSIENIGRHFLGVSSLEKNKAEALVNVLGKDAPFLKLRPHACSITKRWDLMSQDAIVIDATGCQTVGVAIAHHLALQKKKPVVLHSWVHGHGLATVALLSDPALARSACFRCLWKIENGRYKPRYSLSRNPQNDVPLFVGCHHSYHSYMSSVSMTAATQAMRLLFDHLNDSVNHTLKFNILNSAECENRRDTTPLTSLECPVCQS